MSSTPAGPSADSHPSEHPPSTGAEAATSSDGTPSVPPPADDKLDRGVLLVASVVVLGAIMSILDVTVVNVAIKTLALQFDSPLPTIQWVATGYTLALATVIPLTGWGADRFGTKRLYITSTVLFVLGSILSGAAWSAESLIGFRVLQGFGGGMLMPLGMTILTKKAGPHRVGRVMAVIGVPMLLGPIVGPILGGYLVDNASWRWIFLINVPIGVVAVVMASKILAKDVPAPHERLDWLGLLLLSPGLATLIYGLAKGGQNGGFGKAEALGPVIAGVVLLAVFVWHGLRTPHALVDLRLYANRVFSASTITLMLMVISVFGGMILIPLYLQSVRGESAMSTGLLLAPQGLGAMIAMPIAGQLTDRTGVGRIVPFGLAVVAASFVGLTRLEGDTSYWTLGVYLFLMGVGMGFTMMPTFSGAMQTLRRGDISRASTSLNITQQAGASLGTAVMVILLTRAIADRLPGAGGGFSAPTTPLPPAQQAQVTRLLSEAFGHTFWWALALVVVAFVVALVLLPKHKPEPLEEEGAPPLDAPALMH
jgi:EmrB/QacA subfamily drug resistance transporter